MFETITKRCAALVSNFKEIPSDRKIILEKISEYIRNNISVEKPVRLIYVCTHNSRRSHMGQVWAAVAANYFNIKGIRTFSGGTEATAFHPNAIKALNDAGFQIQSSGQTTNPVYKVSFGVGDVVECFSKLYSHEINPKEGFAAIMTCSDAEDNCPFIPGCDLRIGTTYHDPKAFDQTILQDEKYTERSNQIAMECLYVFSKV